MKENIKNVNQEYEYLKKGDKILRIITTTQELDIEGIKLDKIQLTDHLDGIKEGIIKSKNNIKNLKTQTESTKAAIEIIDDILNNIKDGA